MIDTYPEVIQGYEAGKLKISREDNPYQEDDPLSMHLLWDAGFLISWAEKLKEEGR